MTSSTLDEFIKSNYGMLRFISMCAVVYGAIYLLYSFFIIDTTIFGKYLEFSADLGSKLVNSITDFETKLKKTNGLMTKIQTVEPNKRYVIVARGCDASIVFAVLISTLSAWPGKWRHKIPAIVLGIAIMFGLNIARIAGMSITETIDANYFDIMHEWILPTVLVFGALVYFYIWTLFSGEHPDDYQFEKN